MAQEAHTSEGNGSEAKSSAKGKHDAVFQEPAAAMADFFQNMDPQKIFPFVQVKKGDLEPLVEANIEIMRAFDGMFQSWAAGFSSRNQERIHTLEECLKCDNQAETMKLQSDCMQRLTKHWMADNQKLGGILFDALGKAVKQSNSSLMAGMKKVSEGARKM